MALLRHLLVVLFFAVIFISGACSVAYQAIWVKMFTPVFGIGLYSAVTVVSSFMAGLVLGSWLCGRIVDRARNLLGCYGAIAILIGLSALVLPLVMPPLTALVTWFYRNVSSDFHVYSVFRFAVAFAVLIVPCCLMGATLPLMTRFGVTHLRGTVSGAFSGIYAVNTLGAVAGCSAAAFYLIERFGVTGTSRLFVTLNLAEGLVALGGAWLCRRARNQTMPEAAAPADAGTLAPPPDSMPSRAGGLMLGVVFVSGFCALAFEVLWLRCIVSQSTRNVYLFPTVLVMYLVGTAVGSAAVALTPLARLRNNATAVGAMMLAAAIVASSSFLYLFHPIWPSDNIWVISAIVVLPLAVVMGMVFPLFVGLFASRGRVGRDVGSLYAINTLGCVAGSFATGFVLIPLIGLRATLLACLVAYLVAAITVPLVHRARPLPWLATCGALVLALNVALPRQLFHDIFGNSGAALGENLVFYKEGTISSVGVFTREAEGRTIASVVFSDRSMVGAENPPGELTKNHRLKAHIPALLHPRPGKVLNIGFGTGTTARSVSLHESVQTLRNVEICPEALEAAKYFFYDTASLFSDPRVETVIDDGRNVLIVNDDRYDIICIYPFNAIIYADNVYFYTRDFLELCRSRLAEGGFVSLWFPVGQMGHVESRILVKTFLEVFPEAALWNSFPGRRYEDVKVGGMLLGYLRKPDDAEIARQLQHRLDALNSDIAGELSQCGIYNSRDFLAYRVCGAAKLRQIAEGETRVATDDHTYVDYQVRRRNLTPQARAEEIYQQGVALAAQGKPADAQPFFHRAMELNPGQPDFHNGAGGLWAMQGDYLKALGCFEEALKRNPWHAEAHRNKAQALLSLARLEDAEVHARSAVRLEPNSWQARAVLGNVLAAQASVAVRRSNELGRQGMASAAGRYLSLSSRKNSDAAAEWRASLRLNPDNATIQYNLGLWLDDQEDEAGAMRHFARALQLQPDFDEAKSCLNELRDRKRFQEHSRRRP